MSGFFGRMSSRTAAATPASDGSQRPPFVTRSRSTDSKSSDDEAAAASDRLDGAAARASALRRHQRRADTASTSSAKTRAKRRPVVVRYELSAAAITSANECESDGGGALSDDAAPFAFDVESAMAGYAASFSPSRKTTAMGGMRRSQRPPVAPVTGPPPRARAQTRATRLTMSLSRSQRAELKAQKYDVDWRADQDCACCQVCYAMFTKLSRRRHHCRVCGDLVCGDCSGDQVLLVGRFDAPKRACVACVTLLQVMLHNGDARVSLEGSSKQQQAATATANTPLATPKYHDRLGEVHRVMAAGKKSERRGSTQSEMYVISSTWLRRWLAFTRAASDDGAAYAASEPAATMADVFASSSTSTAFSSPSNSLIHAAAAAPPGPIDNMALLELSKGKLVKRPELFRDDCADGGSTGPLDGVAEDSGYQFISTEVWEVLQRLYGGGPGIRVSSADGFSEWLVDVSTLLAAAAGKVFVSPTVERVLVTRHEAAAAVVTHASCLSVEKAALISSGGYDSTTVLSQSAGPSTPNPLSASSNANALDKSSPAGAERGSVGSRGSFNQARVRPNSPKKSAITTSSDASTASAARASTKFPAADSLDDLRDSRAATAASAFALAMKQARLNAQKALDDRSRGTQHAEAA